MQRTRTYEAPSGNVVMAQGRVAGSTVHFDDENKFESYDDAYKTYQSFGKEDTEIKDLVKEIGQTDDAVKKERKKTEAIQLIRKFFFKNKIDDWRPPYAPKLGDTEIRKLSRWIVEQEERLSALENDKTYQFVKLVAGNLSQDVDSLLIFNRDKRHSKNPFFEVPGDNSWRDVSDAREKIIETIAETKEELVLETVLNRVLAVLTTKKKATEEPGQGGFLLGGETFTEPFRRTGNFFLNLNADLTFLFEDSKKKEEKNSWDTVGIKQTGRAEIPYTAYQRFVNTVEALRNREYKEESKDNYYRAFPEVDDLQKAPPYDWFAAQKEDVAKECEYAYKTAQPSFEMLELEQELDSLTLLLKKTDLAASRQRMFGGLDWTERLENMKTADMIPELFMGIEKATVLVQRNVPSLQDVPDHSFFIEHSENGFRSLFAELVARQINVAHFFEGVRGSFDRNHARVRLTIERLLHAMRGYVFVDNKVRLNSNGRQQQQWRVDRLDYM